LNFKSNFDQSPHFVKTNDKEENLNFPIALKLNSHYQLESNISFPLPQGQHSQNANRCLQILKTN
jgi:hypothetical protein